MYLISAEMLGPEATESDAKKMVELLTERGYAVAFGEPVDNDTDYINDDVWTACLNRSEVVAVIQDENGDWTEEGV